MSWYDGTAEKVIKGVIKLNGDKLDELLHRYGCTQEQLPDYGLYPTGKPNEYVTYESSADLRDSESIPLLKDGDKQGIHDYFLEEVKPHVEGQNQTAGRETLGRSQSLAGNRPYIDGGYR